MNIVTITAYIFSAIFLIFLVHAVISVLKTNREQRQIIRRSQKIKKEKEQLKKLGLKEFYFGKNKKVMIMAKDYKEAAALYQTNRKNGKY